MNRVRRFLRSPAGASAALGVLVSLAALVTLLWVWGFDPQVFPTPDEAVVRLSAAMIRDTGSPALKLPFADPEDLAHPRSWVTLGEVALPTYAPLSLYVYGWLLKLGSVGLALVAVLSASAVGALCAGLALLLPSGRRWLALLAPGLAFPSSYWVLRPWVNLSTVLIGSCWAFAWWATWRYTGRRAALYACAVSVGVAAAVRPDYAAWLLATALLLSLAVSLADWRAIAIAFVLAGVFALGINMILNQVATGNPLRAAYQVALERQWGPVLAPSAPGLGTLRAVLMPIGWPDSSVALTVGSKYLVGMGPIAALLVGQVALVPLLRGKSRWAIACVVVVWLFAWFFVYTHLHDDNFGGQTPEALPEHSVPRYLTPLYLLAALPPLVLIGRLRRPLAIGFGALALFAAAFGLYEIAQRGPTSFHVLHATTRENTALLERLGPRIPPEAMVYSIRSDKLLWSRWRLGTIEDPRLSAASVKRALESGIQVYVLEPRSRAPFPAFVRELNRARLRLEPVDRRRGLTRVVRLAPAP